MTVNIYLRNSQNGSEFMDAISFTAILSVALLGGFGHCIGMCGGFIAALSGGKMDERTSLLKRQFFYSIYHIGRVSSYALIGAVCGLLGQMLSISQKTQGLLFFTVGCFMMFMGFSLIGKIRFLSFIENTLILKPFTKKIYSFLISSKNLSSFYFLGLLNGFMPCGLVYFFAASAAASGSVFWGAVIMVVFGIATLPSLIGFGFIVEFGKTIFMKVAAVVVILYGVYISYNGYMAVIGQ